MSGIQVLIPATLLKGLKSFEPEEILAFFEQQADKQQIVDRANLRVAVLENLIRNVGIDLEKTIEDDDQFRKARNLRNMVRELKAFEAKRVGE